MTRHDVIGPDPRRAPPTFGLFAEAVESAALSDEDGARTVMRQREAAPEVARPVVAKARLEMPGPSTEARRIAHEAAVRSLDGRRGKILAALEAHGPMTRLALHQVTGLSENSVNSAVNALLTDRRVRLLDRPDPTTNRSIVALTEASHD